MKQFRWSLAALALGLVILVGTAPAQNGTLSRNYDVMPKRGMEAQFEAALKAHAAFRMANNDPWEWAVLMVETGPDAGGYHIRSGAHSWADFDAYDAASTFQEAARNHWNSTVAPLIGSFQSSISQSDTSISHWPADWDAINFVTVTTYRVRPTTREQFFADVKTAHTTLMAGGWTSSYAWAMPVSGGMPGEVSIAGFHTNWADMAEPDPNFFQVMTKQLGEKKLKEWRDHFLDTFMNASTVTMRWRRDLGVTK
jgi:hypothetical protein